MLLRRGKRLAKQFFSKLKFQELIYVFTCGLADIAKF